VLLPVLETSLQSRVACVLLSCAAAHCCITGEVLAQSADEMNKANNPLTPTLAVNF